METLNTLNFNFYSSLQTITGGEQWTTRDET